MAKTSPRPYAPETSETCFCFGYCLVIGCLLGRVSGLERVEQLPGAFHSACSSLHKVVSLSVVASPEEASAFKNLLKAASFGRHFLTESPGCPDRHREAARSAEKEAHLVVATGHSQAKEREGERERPAEACRSLRICRELRKAPIEIPITPAQLEKLGIAGTARAWSLPIKSHVSQVVLGGPKPPKYLSCSAGSVDGPDVWTMCGTIET